MGSAEELENEESPEALQAPSENSTGEDNWSVASREGLQLVERSRQLLEQMHEEDREEVIDLNAQIETAVKAGDASALQQATHDLREVLFFVEGRA